MSYTRNLSSHGGIIHDDYCSSTTTSRNDFIYNRRNKGRNDHNNHNYNNHNHDYSAKFMEYINGSNYARSNIFNHVKTDGAQSLKRRKCTASTWEDSGRHFWLPSTCSYGPYVSNDLFHPPPRSYVDPSTSTRCKRDFSKLEDDEPLFMSRDEIERYSPSRKDGIDALRETNLRYTYCAFLQNLGLRLELPQTTIGTAMVLCHRFFVRRSHACHDRFLIATAALFLAGKSEETPRPLNNVLRTSCEILHKQDATFLSFMLPLDWFERYKERITEAEQMILTTLNFELNVQHPYDPLTSVLNKIGLSQSVLVNLALNLVSEGITQD